MERFAQRHPDRPMFHVMAAHGWINDPNGPLFYKGIYHLFYQHVPDSTSWQFGIVWGHAVSKDLVQWRHLPAAISPTDGDLDGDGCFSGCCVVNEEGVPTILYTGVRLRNNPNAGDLPDPDDDLGLPFIESLCFATPASGDDPFLTQWEKLGPGLKIPPAELRPAHQLAGWRDPFIFKAAKDNGDGEAEYIMYIGSGIKGEGGTVLKYKSPSVMSGWTYDGVLCKALSTKTGGMWECPLLADLSNAGGQGNRDHFFCISPDAPTKKVLYWLGEYKDGVFVLEEAVGPYILDLGDIMYAPNILVDEEGRTLLWGWLQERDGINETANYAGCMTVPRILSIRDGHLHQEPAPEIDGLHGKGGEFEGFPKTLDPNSSLQLAGLEGRSLDVQVTIEKESASMAGIFIRSWEDNPNGTAAVMYDWSKNLLEILYGFDLAEKVSEGEEYSAIKCVGGIIPFDGPDKLELRVLIDGSCVEAYTNTGAVLSARVYRGYNLEDQNGQTVVCKDGVCEVRKVNPEERVSVESGVWVLCTGGSCQISKLAAWEMSTIWDEAPTEWVVATSDASVVPVTATTPYGTLVGRCAVCGGLHHESACPLK